MLQHQYPHLLVLAQLFIRAKQIVLFGELHKMVFGRFYHHDTVVVGRLAVQKHLFHVRALLVDIFHLFRSDILSLLQLENVFLPVDNSDPSPL